MRTMLKKAVGDESGKVLILALIVLVVGGLLLGPLLGLMSTGLSAGQVYENKTSQLYAADAGVEDAIHWLVEGRPVGWPWGGTDPGPWERYPLLQINDSSVNVTIVGHGPSESDTYKITSTAKANGRSATVISIVRAPARFKGCYVKEGGLALGTNNNTTIEGDLIVVGDVTLNQHSSLAAGGVLIEGNLILQQNTSITADVICLTGNIILENRTAINADIHFLGPDCTITVDQPQSFVNGNMWAEGNLTIRILYGSNPTEIYCPEGVYAPDGAVALEFGHPNAELIGDIWAGGGITVFRHSPNWGTHTGTSYPNYSGEEPFAIAPCPTLATSPVIIYSYEVT